MSRRTDRVGELVRRTVSEILNSGFVRDPRLADVTLSVTAVNVSGDLSIASVYVDVFGETPRERVLKGLRASAARVRGELGRQIELRKTPELRFFIDDSIEKGNRVEQILHDLKQEKTPEPEPEPDTEPETGPTSES